jgi:hypothetical protein
MGGGNNNNDCSSHQIIQQITSSPSTTTTVSGTVNKKRKLDQAMAISDSSDEGLGSMSPEPVSQMIFANGSTSSSNTITKPHHINATNINVKDYVNLQNQMETERRHRIQLEEQLKLLEMQVYSSQPQQENLSTNKYPQEHHQEIVDEIDAGHNSEGEDKIILHSADVQEAQIHYISTASNVVPHHSQYVVVSTSTPGASPKHITIVNDDDDNSRTLSSDELHKDDEVSC